VTIINVIGITLKNLASNKETLSFKETLLK